MNRLGRRNRFRATIIAIVTVLQLPAVAWLCARAHSPLPLLGALLVSYPYLRRLETPWSGGAPGPSTYVALAWWSACIVFAVLLPLAWLLSRLGLSSDAAFGSAGALAVWSGWRAVRRRPRVRRREVRIAGLPMPLDGYRIGQLSDVHCGPHTPAERVAEWVDRLNALDVDLLAVTGDLITHGATHTGAVARALGALQARDGVFACMGNHDYFTDAEGFVAELERAGLSVLRNRGVVVERDGARLYVAGVDDTWTARDDVAGALSARPDGVPTVLLAHDPNLFPQAAAHEVDLMLSGHTHGGQLAVPGVRRLSLARLVSHFTAGLYRRGRSWLYVSRGAGTTGPPVRLGAPAELTVLTLRAG